LPPEDAGFVLVAFSSGVLFGEGFAKSGLDHFRRPVVVVP
jgi:hypothetical protein